MLKAKKQRAVTKRRKHSPEKAQNKICMSPFTQALDLSSNTSSKKMQWISIVGVPSSLLPARHQGAGRGGGSRGTDKEGRALGCAGVWGPWHLLQCSCARDPSLPGDTHKRTTLVWALFVTLLLLWNVFQGQWISFKSWDLILISLQTTSPPYTHSHARTHTHTHSPYTFKIECELS